MTRRGALILVFVAAVVGWWMLSPRTSWRYRMTVEVDTPDGVRSGSAVRLVNYRPGGGFFIAEGRPSWKVQGQAVIVDLPNGRSLFALLRSASRGDVSYGARIADRALGVTGGRIAGYPGPVDLYPTAPKTSGLGQTNPLPMLVTFAELADPKTVQLVDPHNLEATFGPGYALKRVTIDVVERPITTGIEQRLSWLGPHLETPLDLCHDIRVWTVSALSHGDFRRGPSGEGWRGWDDQIARWKAQQAARKSCSSP